VASVLRDDHGAFHLLSKSRSLPGKKFVKGYPAIFAAAPAMRKSLKLWRRRDGGEVRRESESRRMRIRGPRQHARGVVAAGARSRRMASHRGRHGFDGAVFGGKFARPEAGEHLEPAGVATD
jgi:hypothetical protein